MTLNNNPVLATAFAVLLGLTLFHTAQAASPPADANGLVTHEREIIAPVEPRHQPQERARTLQTTSQAACDMDGYAQNNGQALVEHILQSDSACIDNLYDGNATSFAAFTRERMIAVAESTAQMAASYSADAGDASINKLYYFLRAGYYIEYYYPDDTEAFGDQVQTAVTTALDTFIANGDFYSASASHGSAIIDAIVLMDSAGEQARYLPVIKEWLQRWDQQAAQYRSMRSAVNGIFTLLFRGHYDSTFVDRTRSDNQLMQQLGGFARSDWSEALFMQENAARELSRFLQYTDAPVYDAVVDEVDQLLTHYSIDGTGSSVWLAAANNVDYFGQCAQFGICGFAEDLEQQVLAHQHTCSATLKIRAQDMTQVQMSDSCAQLSSQEGYFHQMLATGYNPVADDLNEDLEVVVFDDWSEYDSYAPLFYGIGTNNGGMYLEGNPSAPDNQARFIAHEADWLRPDFEVWNLTHEYVHYLDGRFNLYGDFSAAGTGTHKTVWWIEGLAEYISKKDYNDDAIALAHTGQFQLNEIFANTYNSGTDRVYKWGYLAVRFMFERHRDDVTQMLTYFRAGNYDGYLNYINGIGSNYDSEWQGWLAYVQSTQDGGDAVDACATSEALEYGQVELGTPSCLAGGDGIRYFYVYLPEGTASLDFALSGGDGNADLYVNDENWATASDYDQVSSGPGNSESLSVASPDRGWYYVSLIGNSSDTTLQITAN